jgi:Fur family ferric uptake transcriptional regulator
MNKNTFSDSIKAAHLRVTKPRLILLTYLQRAKRPQSILEIAAALKKDIDQVTVYRSIDALKKVGIVRELDLRQGHPLYEITDEQDHHHIVCLGCDRMENFNGCDSARLAKNALKQTTAFGKITGHSFEFFGFCNVCIKSNLTTV